MLINALNPTSVQPAVLKVLGFGFALGFCLVFVDFFCLIGVLFIALAWVFCLFLGKKKNPNEQQNPEHSF